MEQGEYGVCGRGQDSISAPVRRILDRALDGADVSVEDATELCAVTGADLQALTETANALRQRQVGPEVTYVVNRNINFTNLCVMSCKFCAFSRTRRSGEGYYLDVHEVVRRARQAVEYGATEICVQAGLPPNPKAGLYTELISTLKAALPELHIHGMSPEEVRYGAKLEGIDVSSFLSELKDAGLGSVPGTSAEILDDTVRERLAGGRITTAQWQEVIQAAHGLGLPTTATLMYGHIETDRQRMQHLDLLRAMQRETGGFTEFVPLSFVHAEAPLHFKRMLSGVRPGPTGNEIVRLYAIARLMLGDSFKNIQVSWVKEGLRFAQRLLDCGANDLGGTLLNESISTAAGAQNGQFVSPRELRRVIRDAGRVPVQRRTDYSRIATFSRDGLSDPEEPLDGVTSAESVFGSYQALTAAAGLVR